MAELNGYYFRNLLKSTRRRFALNAGEQALYQELVDICNEEYWSKSFQVSNGELTTALNCNEKTLASWRQSLIDAGLIIYNSGKSKREFGNYSLVVKTPVKITTNTSTNTSDYIQLNKTKLNKTKLNKTNNTREDFFENKNFDLDFFVGIGYEALATLPSKLKAVLNDFLIFRAASKHGAIKSGEQVVGIVRQLMLFTPDIEAQIFILQTAIGNGWKNIVCELPKSFNSNPQPKNTGISSNDKYLEYEQKQKTN